MVYAPLNVSGNKQQLLCCKEIRLKLGKARLETTCFFYIDYTIFLCLLSFLKYKHDLKKFQSLETVIYGIYFMRGICEIRNAKNLLLSTADRNVVKDRFLESITFGQQEKKLSSILRQFNEEKITLEKVLARQR